MSASKENAMTETKVRVGEVYTFEKLTEMGYDHLGTTAFEDVFEGEEGFVYTNKIRRGYEVIRVNPI